MMTLYFKINCDAYKIKVEHFIDGLFKRYAFYLEQFIFDAILLLQTQKSNPTQMLHKKNRNTHMKKLLTGSTKFISKPKHCFLILDVILSKKTPSFRPSKYNKIYTYTLNMHMLMMFQ